MSWANLDDGFADHPKVIDLPDAAFRLHVCAMCWCSRRLTDGLVRSRELRILGAMLEGCPDDQRLQELAQKLVDARLWDPCEEGWRLHDWLKHNESAQKVIERREAAKQRMAENRKGKGSEKRTFAGTSRERSEERAPERSREVRVPSPLLSSPLPTPNPTEEAKASTFAVGHAPPPPSGTQGALIPDVLASPKRAPERNRKPRKARPAKDSPETTARTNPVWEAYSAAYLQEHKALPTRNGMINGQLADFLDRVPADEAPAIAAFYARHPDAWLRKNYHPIGALLKNAEGYRTEWLRGQQVTMTEARRREHLAEDGFAKLARKLRQQEQSEPDRIELTTEDR